MTTLVCTCQLCGKKYEPVIGCVTLDVAVANGERQDDGDDPGVVFDQWTEVDFCKGCSAQVLALIGKSLEELQLTLAWPKPAGYGT